MMTYNKNFIRHWFMTSYGTAEAVRKKTEEVKKHLQF